jgi:uncharacterized protein (TIGR02246 family)
MPTVADTLARRFAPILSFAPGERYFPTIPFFPGAAAVDGRVSWPLASQSAADTLPVRVAERQIETFNRRDLDGFMALYADDAVVAEFPSGTVLWRGKAAIRERYAAMFRTLPRDFPPVRVEPRIVDGAFVIDYEAWDAKPGEPNHAIWMYEVRGGLIRRAWTVRLD